MVQGKQYYAFISYKREDKKEAKRLQHALEYYRLPSHLRKEKPELPEYVRPIFRDMTALEVGELSAQIHTGLEQSHFLIVVCSPRAAASKWVNDEVEYFISLGKHDRIVPYIIEGVPHSSNTEEECYPPALLRLSKEKELLGANINEVGKDSATIRVVSRMFDIRFDTLYQRFKRERKRRVLLLSCFITLAFLVLFSASLLLFELNRNAQINQARFVSEEGLELISQGDSYLATLLALEVLPNGKGLFDKPYTVEAERLLRESLCHANTILRGHTNWVNFASFSNDNTKIVTASKDLTIKIWDNESGACLKTLTGHTRPVVAVGFCNDDKRIISAAQDNTIRIWDTETGDCITTIEGIVRIHGRVCFSPDSRHFLVANPSIWDESLKEFDVNAPESPILLSQNSDGCASYSKDGKYIVAANGNHTISIWEVATHDCLTTLPGHASRIRSVRFSPDGHKVISAASDSSIVIWDIVSGRSIMKLKGHFDDVTDACFSPDGDYIASSSWDRTVKLWSAQTGECIGTFRGHLNDVKSVCFNSDGSRLLSISYDNTARIIDIKPTNSFHVIYKESSPIIMVTHSGSGRFIAIVSRDSTIKVLDANTFSCIATLQGHLGRVNSVFFNVGENRMVSASDDKTIKIWDIKSGKCLHTLTGHTKAVSCAIFDEKDENIVISGSLDHSLRRWSIDYGKCLDTLILSSGISSISNFSNNGLIATSLNDLTIRIWSIDSEQNIITLPGHTRAVMAMQFSIDGKYLISATSYPYDALKVWNAKSGECVSMTKEPIEGINQISLKTNGRNILTASADSTLRVWDMESLTCFETIHWNSKITSSSYSPQGNSILFSSSNGEIVSYEWKPLQEIVRYAKERFSNRQLSAEERHRYYVE